MPSAVTADTFEPLAIIGLSCKFPGDADTPESFWRMIEERKCAMKAWPEDRVKLETFSHRDSKEFIAGAHFMKEDPTLFDASFFGIGGAEAAVMDPQHRMVLETAYRAFENAGIPMEKANGTKTAVYSGCMTNDYTHMVTRDPENIPKHASIGTTASMVANRLSWFFNLNGPCVNLDSACSSSLMAFDMACTSLRVKDADMALVAGVSAILGAETIISLMNMSFLSPDGRSYSFDARANGYGRGEGCGVVVVKRLADAVRDGNVIRAVIRSTGSNQDGYTPGITQPSRALQSQLIRDTYDKAGLNFESTRFFEAHGTGTAVGDPIEAEAIGSVFRKARSPDDPLYIGAAKSNIGHLEGGSGIAAVIKTVLVLEKGIIPPNSVNFESLNPEIDAEFLNIKIPTKPIAWPTPGLRRASVSSFGYGGSNAHVVLDDAYHYLQQHSLDAPHCTLPEGHSNATNGHAPELTSRLLILSGEDEGAIGRMVDAYKQYANSTKIPHEKESRFLGELAETLSAKRSQLSWRAYSVVDSLAALKALHTSISKPVHINRSLALGYIFTGQGAQYYGMGQQLVRYPVFKNSLQLCDDALRSFGCSWSAFDLLAQADDESFDINNPEYSQCLTTVLQIALVDLLSSFGFVPLTVIGHSSGEIAAAYAVGGLSRESACQVSYFKGLYASTLRNGNASMLAVDLSRSNVQPYLEALRSNTPGNITVACINSPNNVTISGENPLVETLQSKFEADGIRSRRLRTGVAYHSSQMQAISSLYRDSLQGLTAGSPNKTLMVSTVTGSTIVDRKVLSTPDYWVRNMVEPVEFCGAMTESFSHTGAKNRKIGMPVKHAITDWVEIGPHGALQRPFRETLRAAAVNSNVRYVATLDRRQSPLQALQSAVGHLYAQGYSVSFEEVNQYHRGLPQHTKQLVNLPSYPFNHSRRYWFETRETTNVRLRSHGRHELLGAPSPESHSGEAHWRLFFDPVQTPWILDHAVNGKAIYPATGMLVMAIEGADQLVDASHPRAGYLVHDATFTHPIVINPSGRVQASLYMRATRPAEKTCHSFEFRIYTEVSDQLQETCRGYISVQLASEDVVLERQEKAQSAYHQERWEEMHRKCSNTISKQGMYEALETNGLHYGPAFQVMDSITWDGDECATAEIHTFPWTAKQSQHGRQRHVVHPATLDGLGQLGVVPLTHGGQKLLTTGLVTTRVQQAWIAASGASSPDTSFLRACVRSHTTGMRGTETEVTALDESGQVKIWISSFETTSMTTNHAKTLEAKARPLCGSIEWNPVLDFMTKSQLSAWCDLPPADNPQELFDLLEVLQLSSARRAIEQLKGRSTAHLPGHLHKYIDYLKWQIRRYDEGTVSIAIDHPLLHSFDPEVTAKLCEKVKALSQEAVFSVTAAQNLDGILAGTAEPLDLLYQDDRAAQHYQAIVDRMLQPGHLRRYLKTLALENPAMKVLEIGAGTGSFTSHVLHALAGDGGSSRFGRYDYTDISEGFFEKARERFGFIGGKIAFRALNVEKAPEDQGFEKGSYDLIVGAWVLHTTADLNTATRNIRELLKPGGKLVMIEITQPENMRTAFVTGTLPGWWMDYREHGACVGMEKWNDILQANGFDGIDLAIPECGDERYVEHSLLVATASRIQSQSTIRPVVCVIDPASALQASLVQTLRQRLPEETEWSVVSMKELDDISLAQDPVVLFLPEVEGPVLATMSETLYDQLHRFFCRAQDVMWVMASSPTSLTAPRVHIIQGLVHVLCTENERLSFTTLDLEDHLDHPTTWVDHIHRLLQERQQHHGKDPELDYREQNGVLHVGRVIEDLERNNTVLEQTQTPVKWKPFRQEVPLSLYLSNPGSLDASTMVFVEDMEQYPELAPTDMEIEVKSVGVNFRDVLTALGRIRSSDNLGCEFAGVVTRVGKNCVGFQPGDTVCAVAFRCVRTLARCDYRQCCRIPAGVSMATAASVPTIGVTAYHSLIILARLQPGESVLIHSAAGGTGQLAIQVARSVGAKIFVTVGSQEKARFLQDRYGIAEDHIMYSRDTTFSRHIRRMTDGQGVDVILNSLSGDALVASWECIAPYGRFIELGRADIDSNSKLPMRHFEKNVSFFVVSVDRMSEERPALIRQSLQPIMDMMEAGTLHPPWPLQEFSLSSIEEALRLMQNGRHTGKLVINFNPTDIVPISIRHTPSYSFPSDATYVIAGGLGGLGRSAARWMANMGAKNLILLSRSGPKSDAARKLIADLASQGVCVRAPKCDVADILAMKAALGESVDLPPIRGCLQATMVLQDAIFENLTYVQWTTAIRSKVQSTENLHAILPSNMDFFVMLSSLAGVVGSVSQAAYAAGNTFQDAFATYRRSLGQEAVSLDLGRMGEVGIIAENTKYSRHKEDVPVMEDVSEREFHAMLEQVCRSTLGSAQDSKTGQILLGMATPAQMRAAGIDPPSWVLERSLFSVLPQEATTEEVQLDSNAATSTAAGNWQVALAKASPEAAGSVVVDGLTQKLAHALDVAAGEIDSQRSMAVQGVDSLLAVELRQWISKAWKADVSALDITSTPSLEELAVLIVGRSELLKKDSQ
ncbi:polyketide synthase [Aspergillus steynii IBT 23096]|uniref:Polyketide synthase n=1 Tax=Aspergillus steynii IBT 23096 TaxID=1392250 RepID=A0A2I2GHF6_9EURO|nr:polyketide synthase [Aspergillus steynii IBT 23096]PLB52311.1 polyketide synthase [Aspergillus steynii IBT 23096]